MSARVDLAEFLTAYLAEVEEQISVANSRVLVIDSSNKKGEPNPRAVRDLFRALHTVKGLSAMVGVEPVVEIAHRMEAVLRGADRLGGALSPAALEPLIAGLRAIELRVQALAAKKPVPAPPGALLASLDALETGISESAAPAAPALDLEPALRAKLAAFETQQLLRATLDGQRAVRLEFIPSPTRAAAGQSINSVRERLAAVADIVKVIPVALPPSETAPGGLSFVLLVVTAASDETLAATAGLDAAAVRAISHALAPKPATAEIVGDAPGESVLDADPELPDEHVERRGVLRVDVARVDDAMEKLSSLIVSRSRLARAVSALSAAAPGTRELRQIAADVARQIRDLRASILQVRMVRVGEILERVPLVVRGLRRITGKEVRLEIDAGDAELDKAVAERIFPAILHLVRNAVDHGLESPEARRAAGKSEEGLIRITTSSRSNTQLELLVSDDGRGIDPARVAAHARAEVPTTDSALLDLLCRPGLSTREEVTTTSGRGMGMDIVRRVVEGQLGGELRMTTRLGLGTTFVMHVPLTIAIVDAFVAQCGEERFVIPVGMVEEILEVDPRAVTLAPRVSAVGSSQMGLFLRRGEAVPLLDLASVLGIVAATSGTKQALIVRRGGQPVAFVLDRVVGQQEAVVRPLVDPLVHVPGVSGATDLGDGRPTLVLDLVALAGAPRLTRLPSAPSAPRLMSSAEAALPPPSSLPSATASAALQRIHR